MADSTYGALHGFVKAIEKSALGTAAVPWPTLPTWPATPPALVAPGIAARRSAWVTTAKKSPNYNADTNGRTLRLEPVVTPFDPTTYVAELKSVDATRHEQVLAKIGKGGGQVTAAHLQMKRGADTAFKTVGMFTRFRMSIAPRSPSPTCRRRGSTSFWPCRTMWSSASRVPF